ncbi:hypothetical protein [Tindallia californiensis]|uniref:Uncharacterized protein n=1 Tax=Tindallia californiensis TaxID=159292 RepID=A0A1H3Q2X2_9FIRM|nr:hypothetical protein [Tindallia californiensis]SDZ07736.1 hypothetical protein SAMN05192546_10847 [Tindallia californiensis]
MVAAGFRLIQVYLILMKNKGIKTAYLLCTIGHGFLTAAGVTLLLFPWALKPWLLSTILFLAGRCIGVVACKIIKRQEVQ